MDKDIQLVNETSIHLGGVEVKVGMLSNGKRIIHVDSLFNLFKIERLDTIKDTVELFVNNKSIKPYVTRTFKYVMLHPIMYIDKQGKQQGYEVKVITLVCELFTTRGYDRECDDMFELSQRIFIEMTVIGIEALFEEACFGVKINFDYYVHKENLLLNKNIKVCKEDNFMPYIKRIGTVPLDGLKVDVIQLSNNVRVINDKALSELTGVSFTDKKGFDGLPWFLSKGYIMPYRTYTLEHLVLDRILYIDANGKTKVGYNITILPIMFETYARAYYKGAIHKHDKFIYHNLRKLFIGLSTVGFIESIDRVLEYVRPMSKPLQYEMNRLISYKPKVRNMVIFDIHFYRPLYKLYKIDGNPDDLNKTKEVIALTDYILYDRLGVGMGKKLRELSKGNNSFFLYLTEDIGFPIFRRMFIRAIQQMDKSKTVEEFEKIWNKLYPMPED